MRTCPSQAASPRWSSAGMTLISGDQFSSQHFPHGADLSTAHSFSRPYPKEWWDFTLKYFMGSCWVVMGVWISHTRHQQEPESSMVHCYGSAWEKKNGPELLCKYRMKHHFYVQFGWSYKNWPIFYPLIICSWRNGHFYLRKARCQSAACTNSCASRKTWEIILPNWMSFISQWVSFKV